MVQSFHLSDEFVSQYADQPVDWGFPIGGTNSLGELTFYSKYSRLKEDGTKERWHETCRRVIQGMFSIQKDHCLYHRVPWNANKAKASAEEAYDRMFTMKWLPPGRGIQHMGTLIIDEIGSAPLMNCAFASTKLLSTRNPALPFVRLMEMSMLGIGVGFDTLGAGNLAIHEPAGNYEVFQIPDSREGWCDSVDVQLRSYFLPSKAPIEFDYSRIRPEGAPLKRFGGTAAGPEPLVRLHKAIDKLFHNRAGQRITSRDIVDICNLLGKCVVAGSSRRSAELALGLADDKDFLDLKNWDLNSERMGPDGWGHLSNNSVAAEVGGDYDHLVDRIAMNGEPGLVYLDLARRYGRLIDPPNDRDYRVAGVNPCVTGDTWVTTVNGPRQVKTLLGAPVELVVDGAKFSTAGFFSTGTQPVFRLETSEGWMVELTDNHQVLSDRGWVEAGQLKPGDVLRLHDHSSFAGWHGEGTIDEGYVLGLLIGDGTFTDQAGTILSSWGDTDGSIAVRDRVERIVDKLGHRSDWAGWSNIEDRNEYRLRSKAFTDLASGLGIARFNKTVTPACESASSSFQLGLIRGLFDADGHVEGSKDKSVSVRLGQSDYELLQTVQRMLARFGLRAKIRASRPERMTVLPDGQGGKRSYACKASYRLILSGQQAQRFMDLVGFSDVDKSDKFYRLSAGMIRGCYDKRQYAIFERLVPIGEHPVFDVTVPGPEAFDANGLYVHNCAEQTLENNELCTLVEVFPTRCEDKADFLRTLKFAYLYGKSVTLLSTHWPETNEVMTRNRRIGTSLTGAAQFAESIGWTELRSWCNEGYSEIHRYDVLYSEWLGIRESIKTTSVKPSGTVSLLAGVWPGVHWPVAAGDYLRRTRERTTSPLVQVLREAGYSVDDDVMDPEFTTVISFPTSGPPGRGERDVPVWEKTLLAVLMQRYWSDNAVSATFTFMPDEADQIGSVIKAIDGQLKTMSFLPLGQIANYAQMPYEAIDQNTFDEMRSNVRPIDWNRLYSGGVDVQDEKFCDTDRCAL